ncbi:helix-turn-helix domain-containing protein [Geodermatophilus sabuli]|uniref:Helix-turn-helix domain-containing protein n=1 Tax=Geodermatophilus sabuli TaxID=1564158 RepID=A0A7K3W0J4_9ACTN|nr:helix-turn-helix domain-containing protein [Geodermatophilus sabuli]NEK57873.1 helix-turn-helix domain-containing protein [Geodermatophilus sabuli]
MGRTVDTALLAPRDRAEAARTFLDEVWHLQVDFQHPPSEVAFRLDMDVLGPLAVTRTTSSGLQVRPARGQARRERPPGIALLVHERGLGGVVQGDRDQLVRPGSVTLLDLGAPYAFGWRDRGRSHAVVVDAEDLALPADVVRRAVTTGLPRSPLTDLVVAHVGRLLRDVEAVAALDSARSVGTGTVDLLRALVAEAGGGSRLRTATAQDALLAQVLAHARQHLGDPRLDAARIAAAHHVSVRRLYQLCADSGIGLAEWIMAERLERARRDLTDPAKAAWTIAAIGRRWGFLDAGHFSRRFRAAFGLSPREWRRRRREE